MWKWRYQCRQRRQGKIDIVYYNIHTFLLNLIVRLLYSSVLIQLMVHVQEYQCWQLSTVSCMWIVPSCFTCIVSSLSVNDKRRYIGGGKGKKDVNAKAKPTTNFYKHDKIRNRPALNRNLKLATSSTKMVHHTIY